MIMKSLEAYLGAWAGTDTARIAVARAISAIVEAGRDIAYLVAEGPLAGNLAAVVTENVQGEVQKHLDKYANDCLLAALGQTSIAAIASEELEHPHVIDPNGQILVAIDPLDGSSNIETNAPIGTIFSILPHVTGASAATHDAFLIPGHKQLAAGYVLYGPKTTLILTIGEGTVAFTLDRRSGTFILTNRGVQIKEKTKEWAINASNQRHWDDGIRSYVEECLAGVEGPRGEDTNMRWIASLVADCHRILVRGGSFLYPADKRRGYQDGRLRLMYEANPIAMVIEQAGGLATTGRQRILDIQPKALHQRIPLIFGSKTEVERIERHCAEPATGDAPLFGKRGLFREA